MRLHPLALLLAASPAVADTLPLRRGAYVQVGESCASPANVFLRTYDGGGIGSSKAAGCRARVVSRNGDRYVLRQDCVQYGDPSGRTPRATETVRLRITSRTRYTELAGGPAFRLCPDLKP